MAKKKTRLPTRERCVILRGIIIKRLRGIFLRGSGIDVLWPETVALAVMGVSIMSVASLRFRKRLD